MSFLCFKLCIADPDVCMRPTFKEDHYENHEHTLLRTDYALVISENSKKFVSKEIGKCFELNPKSVGSPRICLGWSERKMLLDTGAHA